MTTARPRIHYTPERNWMNDPNGLVFHNGRYHLFYQYNPFGSDHGHMSWGHASSTDLLRWEEHPVAIPRDAQEQIYSGSVVIDHENTAGFAGPGQVALVAIYTSVQALSGIQSQALAYSLDEGMTWTKHAANPVLDRGSRHFRDPKVFWYEGPGNRYWVMVAVEAEARQVLLYRSNDLRSWTLLSTYGPAGAVGGVWECPDLFPLAVNGNPDDTRWVLLISLNPGGIAGGSGTQYIVGDFDGIHFWPDLPTPTSLDDVKWVDYGRDCYAGVTFNGLPRHERILIAWMNNWDYAHASPTSPWRGTMTVPRRLTLQTRGRHPQLRAEPILPPGTPSHPEADLPAAARIDARVHLLDDATARFDIVGDEGNVIVWVNADGIVVDRAEAGDFHPLFPSVESATAADIGAPVDITMIVDSGSIEVFADNGRRTITDLVHLGNTRRLHIPTGVHASIQTLVITDLGDQR